MTHADLAARLEALHPQCLGWALACCGHRREEAEDVLHDAYVGVLDNRLRFNGASSFRTWLFGVIRLKARARARRERLRAVLGATNAARIDGPAAAPLPDAEAITADRRDRTRRALDALVALIAPLRARLVLGTQHLRHQPAGALGDRCERRGVEVRATVERGELRGPQRRYIQSGRV